MDQNQQIVIDMTLIEDISDNDKEKIMNHVREKLNLANSYGDNLKTFKFYFNEDYMKQQNLFNILQNVNKIQNLVISSPDSLLWSNQNIFDLISQQVDIINLKISLYNNKETWDELESGLTKFYKQLPNFENIQSLDINISFFRNIYLQDFIESIKNFKNLQQLSLKFSQIKFEVQGLDALSQYIKVGNQQLKILSLQFVDWESLPDIQTKLLLDAIQTNKNIENLSFSVSECKELYNKFPQDMCEYLPKMNQIKQLTLGFAILELTPAKFKLIFDSLNTLTNIQYLELDLNSSKANAEQIASLLKHQSQLQSLKIDFTEIKLGNKFSLISNQLKLMTQLQNLTLNLQTTEVGKQKKGCEKLFEFLINLQLIHLDINLRNEEFSEDFLIAVCQKIGKCKSIEFLCLQFACYDQEEETITSMLQGLYGCQELKKLLICDAVGEQIENKHIFRQFKKLVDFYMSYG